jgi:hypothetical protein
MEFNGVKRSQSFGNLILGLTFRDRESSSTVKIPKDIEENASRALAGCASPLKVCGGCQKADRWGWGGQEGQGAASSLYHIKH